MEKECSICQEKYRRDQYNFVIKGQRQDSPDESKWQDVYEAPLENVCSKCFHKIISYYKNFISHLRRNKGKTIFET